MVENRPFLTFLSHAVLILGALVLILPLYVAFIGATQTQAAMLHVPLPLTPGDQLWTNLSTLLFTGAGGGADMSPVWLMLVNSLVMALGIAIGKIAVSIIAAFAVVYFDFPFRMTCFWAIFVTLMLPVEVRILPTYKVVADLGLLNSYGGLILPLIASATATFLFRQFFLTVPDELTEAARIDGAGPMRFFLHILLPLSRTPIAALFVIQFIYGWNQYLWPLIITTKQSYYTVVMSVSRLSVVGDSIAQWNLVMALALLATVPPVLVVVFMQRQFVKGLVETEK